MGISDTIAVFIDQMLRDMDGVAELQRSELASRFNCVPSQINYVISTRFSPEHGYIVESRRGGGGYIRISRVAADSQMLIMHTVNAIGGRIDLGTVAALVANLRHNEILSESEAGLVLSAVGNNALRSVRPEDRDVLRAGILKQMLINTVKNDV
ncbi:MAG: CtsR family transcriptional regulator [Oscillospiraceae bacterium]|nr:CtsR family transcriptional regulator [Oscillospiraceae bacterium]